MDFQQIKRGLQAVAMQATQTAALANEVLGALEGIEPREFGEALDRADVNGEALNAGDKVRVTGSDRFGEFETVVFNATPEQPGRSNPRVLVPHPADPGYTASVGRVTRIADGDPDDFAQAQEAFSAALAA